MNRARIQLLCAVLLGSCSMTSGCRHAAPPLHPGPIAVIRRSKVWTADIVRVAKHGDWILMRGYSPGHVAVTAATGQPWSHVGIYDARRNRIVDAAPPVVRTLPLSYYVRRMHRIQVVRPVNYTPAQASQAVAWARSRTGRLYDFPGALGYQRTSMEYCTELALGAYGIATPTKKGASPALPGEVLRYGTMVYDTDRSQP